MPSWEELRARSELAARYVPEKVWNGMEYCNQFTDKVLKKTWLDNIRTNVRSGLIKKHGTIAQGIWKLGWNKAHVGIGAGPSFNKNKDVLKDLSTLNLQYHLDHQPFVFTTSNHMFKPCLDMGIYPHFVMLIDASDVTYEQLCKGVPKSGDNTILVTGVHTSPKILKEWDRQGRLISFYIGTDEEEQALYKELTGEEDTEPMSSEHGGNVLNMAWILGMRYLKSSVYMSVGNDLSFPYDKEYENRRDGYYADGNYESNTGSQRDEARQKWTWLAYDNLRLGALTDSYVYDLKLASTSFQFFTYKSWLESQVLMNCDSPRPFHYFNCSEGGILGVMVKDYSPEKLEDKSNWCLLDDIIPKRWHTWPLADAAEFFMEARQWFIKNEPKEETHTGVGSAGIWLPGTDTVRTAEQRQILTY